MSSEGEYENQIQTAPKIDDAFIDDIYKAHSPHPGTALNNDAIDDIVNVIKRTVEPVSEDMKKYPKV